VAAQLVAVQQVAVQQAEQQLVEQQVVDRGGPAIHRLEVLQGARVHLVGG
jgi:hypothetical protein